MKIHKLHLKSGRSRFDIFAVATTAMLLLLAVTGVFALGQNAHAAQTSAAYCSQYTVNSKLNACQDGILGKDCSDYAITFDQATADVCTNAAKAKANGLINDTAPSPSPTTPITPPGNTGGSTPSQNQAYKNTIVQACQPYQNNTAAAQWCLYGGLGPTGTGTAPQTTQDCLSNAQLAGSSSNQGACVAGATAGQTYLNSQSGASNAGNTGAGFGSNSSATSGNGLQDLLDQASSLSKYIDVLHALGPNANTDTSTAADNNPGSYVNGAGNQQPLKVYPSGVPNGPAILFFNGGGWHSDDGSGDKVANGSPDDNGATPTSGGAVSRGYTSIIVSYRLGSSGIYYMLEDVMRGVQHVKNNASLYNIDPNRIAIWGDSAGGSLSMRAAATGKSGAKAAVGWSAPTNAYTALFKSYKSLLIGADHSTCAPTDLAGLTNATSLLSGGGQTAQYGQGLASNDFSGLGIGGGGGGGLSLNTLTQVLAAAQYAAQTSQNVESITSQLQSGGIQGLSGGVINMSAQKLGECIDNFNTMSPALFASPDTPPSFLAGFELDDTVDPQQLYDMRDKLLGLGVRSEVMTLPGDPNAAPQALSPTANHLGYDARFVCPTVNFLDSILQPDKGQIDCASGVNPNSAVGG